MSDQRPADAGYFISPLLTEHWPQVRAIYLEGIATGDATFETGAPDWDAWNEGHLKHSRVVALRESTVLGWAALSGVSDRCVYGGVAEVSVYVGASHRGQGVGRRLLEALVAESEKNGIWTLQAGIFPENTGSVAIHERCGFRQVGRREKLGKMNGRWRDVLLLERRSPVVGQEGEQGTGKREA
jgi:phosphinothricin acetyltransferase